MFDNKTIWKNISTYQSASMTQKYLYKLYHKQGFPSPETISYDNCYRFIYFLEHGQKYYIQAKASPIEIQPVLLFYGMIQLLKACLLTVDPHYPENSQVLAHGVSTRKRKKLQYEFLYDEVKVQKNGLLTHFSEKMFHVKHLEGEKYKMINLFKCIPELHDLLQYINAVKKSDITTEMIIPKQQIPGQNISEVTVHYLLLYNLSMICRYETEWLGDLLHHYSTNDFPFIKEFLEVTSDKIPILLFRYLNEKT
ncbi:YaaC family protein [Anaerobacillus sp. MEB173]|uniref:YaaC family protein n=1 Tax=Anaerobacillus sp. MEB173 TaxID=3383345 RepID=UPI003F8F97D3